MGTEPSDATPEEKPSQITRVCRKCSAQTTGDVAFCPQCGTRFDRRRRLGKRGRIAVVAVFVALVAGGVATALAVKHHNDRVARQHRLAAERQARQEALARARERAREARQRALHELEVAMRKDLVKSLETSITKDARKDVADGVLDGPILRTECTPVGGGNTDDTAQHTGDFSCLAVSQVNSDGTESGYRFSATVNYDNSDYTWHLGG